MSYLDHAASTSIRPVAIEAWREAALHTCNPSSTHSAGRWGRRLLEESRERIAGRFGVKPDSIFFTSGGTEADNTAVLGTARARRRQDPRRSVVIVSPIEHKAVLEPAEALIEADFELEYVRVDGRGIVELEHLEELLAANRGRVALVAVMWANNEVGTVQPIPEIVAACRTARVPVHSDAVQAIGSPGLDLSLPNTAALSGHKLGGPKGVGMLLHQNRFPLDALICGGGQENGVRAGTSDVPAVAGMAAAIDEVFDSEAAADSKYRKMRDRLVAGVVANVPDVIVNGDLNGGLPGLAHISFPGCEGDALMLLLDEQGIQVSVGSACASGATKSSHVMTAMGVDDRTARGSLRFSLGWSSKDEDIDRVLAALPDAVARSREAGVKADQVTV